MTVPRWISRKGKTVSRLPVLRWKCGLIPRSASRSVHRSLMCQCLVARSPSINQVTQHVEFPQTLYIDKVVVEMPVVMQRKVPQNRTVLKTVEIPPAKFVGSVVEAPVIMQMRQCRLSRSRSASRRVYTNRPSINQVTKHVEIPRGRRPTQFVDRVMDAPGP